MFAYKIGLIKEYLKPTLYFFDLHQINYLLILLEIYAMKSSRVFVVLSCMGLILLTACGTTKYYHSTVTDTDEVGHETYIELQLLKDGTFNEYIYFGLNDSIDNSNEGLLISGVYHEHKDTLYLTYSTALKLIEIPDDSTTYRESYKMTADGLILLEPITYSYHLMNRKMVVGQSTQMRSLPHYATIKWMREQLN